jgi:hypothetical protein
MQTIAEHTVKLTLSHTHAGQLYPAGSELTLPADQANWLCAQGAASPIPAKPALAKPEPRA